MGPQSAQLVRLLAPAQCLEHQPGPHHPEAPARLRSVLDRLAADFPALQQEPARPATDAELAAVHAPTLLAHLVRLSPDSGLAAVDGDTLLGRSSLSAARHAAGAVAQAVEQVLEGDDRRIFCAVRPPGHHAEKDRAMGFCLYNGIAVGAAKALALGCRRVSVVDFDVHHGNGTQDIFWSEARVQYLSSHQMPLYPGTGGREETGVGNIVNEPLLSGSGSLEFRKAWDGVLLPALDAFMPDLVLVSAGFDGHRLDPLAGLNLEADDFAWLTRRLLALSRRHAAGRLVSVLEGGYHLQALADCVSAHVSVLAAESLPDGGG